MQSGVLWQEQEAVKLEKDISDGQFWNQILNRNFMNEILSFRNSKSSDVDENSPSNYNN